MTRAAGVAVALVLAGASAAADEPRVELGGCPVFDTDAARRAIGAELIFPDTPAARLALVRVAVTCPDASAALVEVELSPAAPLHRRVEFGDLVGDWRLRLVALVAAELVGRALAGVPDAAPVAAPAPPPPVLVTAPARPGLGHRRALLGSGETRARGFVRSGARSFLDRPGAMLDVAVGGARGPFALDLFGATRTADDQLGHMRASLAGIGFAATLVCGGGGSTWVCLSARAAAGAASAAATPASAMIVSTDAMTAYVEAEPRLEIRLEHAGWSGELAVALGWSSGLSALAGQREVVRLSGPLVAVALTLGWTP